MKSDMLDKGRIRQKQETRRKILEAAKRLMPRARKLTLEAVADEAQVSRATIYRYFANIDLLITEASLDLHFKTVDELHDELKDLPLADRLFFLQDYHNRLAIEQERGFRRYLSVVLSESITTRKKIRGARRVKSLKKAIDHYDTELDRETRENLIALSSILMGIDPVISLKDVSGLSSEEAQKILRWAMEKILQSVNISKETRRKRSDFGYISRMGME